MNPKENQFQEQLVDIQINRITLEGNLTIPQNSHSIVLFVHGSGSSRFSPRNKFVAAEINKVGIATLLFDLLTKEEELIDINTAEFRFDINLLAERLIKATEWVSTNPETKNLKIGYFGSSTGAAAALIAAAKLPQSTFAVVSRGGRPDLAETDILEIVKAPTLLLVGGDDKEVIELNDKALHHLNNKSKLEIIPGATHLFEEPGKLEEVSFLAARWFETNVE